MKKYTGFLSMLLAMSVMLTGCSVSVSDTSNVDTSSQLDSAAEDSNTSAAGEGIETVSMMNLSASVPCSFDPASLFTDRDLREDYEVTAEITLNGDSASVSGEGAVADGSTVTITAEGVYRISGTLNDGQIVVNAENAKVQLVLDNAAIISNSGSAIYVENAKKVFLTTAAGSENTVSDAGTYADTAEDAPDAAIYSKDSLTINGTGTLTVNGNYQNAITSKDDLVITGSTLHITAAANGIKGKDYVAIAGGTIDITAEGDGIKSTNNTDEGMGFVFIGGGTITIDAQEDAIQAETELVVTGGTIDVTASGGSVNAEPHTGDFGMGGGMMPHGSRENFANPESGEMPTFEGSEVPAQDGAQPTADYSYLTNPTDSTVSTETNTETTTDDTVSVKGLKAGTLLCISGGEITVDAADDALHSNENLYITGGTITLTAGSDGIHADSLIEISGGTTTIAESYEGIEAATINVTGGKVSLTSSDDGFNASDGTPQGAMGVASDAALNISGGEVYVNAGGDGLDSNGDLTISGGYITVDGPTNSGNGALDSNSSLTCTGGTLIAAGASGMAEYPTGSQETIVLTTTETQTADTEVEILDASGNTILTYTPSKTWNSLIVSSPDLTSGETYTVTLNGVEAGSVTMDDTVCFIGEAGGMMGGGMMGGQRQGGNFDPSQMDGEFDPSQLPEDFDPTQRGNFDPSQLPTDENGDTVRPNGRMGGRGFRENQSTTTPTSFEFDTTGRELTQG